MLVVCLALHSQYYRKCLFQRYVRCHRRNVTTCTFTLFIPVMPRRHAFSLNTPMPDATAVPPHTNTLVVYTFYTFFHTRERRQLQRDPSTRQKGRPRLVVGTFLVATLVPGLPSLSGYGRTVRQLRKVLHGNVLDC